MSRAVSKPVWLTLDNAAASISRVLRRVYAAYQRRRRERDAAVQLRGLSDYELKDIGVPRSEIDTRVRFR